MYTIGHGAEPFDSLAERLERHGVRTIVDVRSKPYSSHAPEYSKRALQDQCSASGIGYRYMGDRLGGLSEPQEPLATDGALIELIGLARASPIAVLCSELDPAACHRDSVIGRDLEGRGLRVMNILGDGSVERHQPRLIP